MSADLFAAFGDPPPKTDDNIISREGHGAVEAVSQGAQWQMDNGPEDEDFGDFEAAEPQRISHQADAPDHSQSQHPPAAQGRNADLLFDAENDSILGDSEEDDFGDFEDYVDPQIKAPEQALTWSNNDSHDLFDATEVTQPQSKPPARPIRPKPATRPRPPPPQEPVRTVSDKWEDFSVTEAPVSKPPPPTDLFSSAATILSSMRLDPPSTPSLPPSNVPPPSILLPLFPQIFTTISTTLLTPLMALPPAERHTQLASPALHSILASHAHLNQILARILAGRKLRWRRDTRLAASMRISAAGRSGMKLASVDRSEQAREDAQAAEVLRAWARHVGPLRAVTGAGAGAAKIPDLAATMAVRTATAAEGAVTGPMCAICGLKREERVAKAENTVDDSFGEWWVEKTNLHTGCWRFWEGFKGRLGQR